MKISTKKYIDNQIKWLEKVKQAEIIGIERVKEAEISSMRRAVDEFKSNYVQDKAQANEWRGALKDKNDKNVTKSEIVAWILALIAFAGLAVTYLGK